MEQLHELVTSLQLAGIPLKQGEPLCRHTSFQIGGPVAVMTFPETEEQLLEILRQCHAAEIRPMILGAGTNVLAPDEGLHTLIIETRSGLNEIRVREDGSLEAQCGATMSKLATVAMEHSLTGLEFAHGIPGSVGGGVYMNAGAYGGELVQVVTGARIADLAGNVMELTAGELNLSYRHSSLMERDCVLLSARFRLQPGEKEQIRGKMQDLMARRRASQPLEYPSAGSTFKRPATGYAAALIDQAGLKGLCVGGAQVSEKHAGFVINRGGATSADVLTLMARIQERVYAHSGVRLEPEVRILKEE